MGVLYGFQNQGTVLIHVGKYILVVKRREGQREPCDPPAFRGQSEEKSQPNGLRRNSQ